MALLFSSCDEAASGRFSIGGAFFATSTPSELYFNNMRSSYYEAAQDSGTQINLYRLKRLTPKTEIPQLIPIIAHNWLAEEAYLLIQPNEYENGFRSPLTVYWKNGEEEGKIVLEQPDDYEAQYRFAAELDQALKNKYGLEVLSEQGRRVQLFGQYDQKSRFMTTIRDFRNLIDYDRKE